MLEKNKYYVSLKSKEISKRPKLSESQYEIFATKEEVQRLQSYLNRCLEYEQSEGRSMLNPLTPHESKEGKRQYNEDLNTALNIIYDLGTTETKTDIATI